MEKKVKQHYSRYNKRPYAGEVNTEPSKTVPGQAMTIKELIDRYKRGQSIPIVSTTWETEDETTDEPRELIDFTDIQEVKDELKRLNEKHEKFKQKKLSEEQKKNAQSEEQEKTDN